MSAIFGILTHRPFALGGEFPHLMQLVGSTVSAPRVPRSAKHRPNAPSASTKEYYLRNVAIPFSDHLLSDFSNRFDAESRKGAHLLGLLPGAVTKAKQTLQS